MTQAIRVELEVPDELAKFRLPDGVQTRLQELLERQNQGDSLSQAERDEAEGLVDLSELLSLLRLRAQRLTS
ncbi:MAG: hypothetical protein ACR2RB_10005 [Gammaproteobacteria bacterium]